MIGLDDLETKRIFLSLHFAREWVIDKKRLQILVNAGTVCDSGIDIDMLYFMHFSGDWKINNLNALFVSLNASCLHFRGRLQFLGFCQFWGNLNFLGFLPFYGHFSFVIVFILGVVYLIINKYF